MDNRRWVALLAALLVPGPVSVHTSPSAGYAHPGEQRWLAGAAGSLPDGPTVGVFLDARPHLARTATVMVGGCRADGRRELRVRVTLRPTVRYLIAAPARTRVLVVTPTGGTVERAVRDGRPVPYGVGALRRRTVGVLTVDLPAGRAGTVEFTLLTGVAPPVAPPLVRASAGVKARSITAEPATPCRPER
jgi:hypothetical protein